MTTPKSPPGDTIADLLEEKGISRAELAQKMGRTSAFIAALIAGEKIIVWSTAMRLSNVLGSSIRFWLAREKNYREGR